MRGSPPNFRVQKAWLNSTTAGFRGSLSSGNRVRPSAAAVPSIVNALPVTMPPDTCSGISTPVRARPVGMDPASSGSEEAAVCKST